MKCNQGVKDKCFFQGWNHNVVNAYKMFAARIKTVTQREVAVNVEGCSQKNEFLLECEAGTFSNYSGLQGRAGIQALTSIAQTLFCCFALKLQVIAS